MRLVGTPACVDALGLDGVELLYRLSRHAIFKVQDRVRKKTLDYMGSELTCESPPRNGDLTKNPLWRRDGGLPCPREALVSKKIRRVAAVYFCHLSWRDGC